MERFDYAASRRMKMSLKANDSPGIDPKIVRAY